MPSKYMQEISRSNLLIIRRGLMCNVKPEAASFMEFSMGPILIKPIWPIKHWPDFYFNFIPHDTRKIPARYHGETERKNKIPEKHETIYFIFQNARPLRRKKFLCSKLPSNYTTKISLLLSNLPAQVSDAWQLQRKPR
jgi:hypothetical protein